MSHEKPKAKPIFAKALEIEEPEARESYLDDACGGNAELRAEVADLLAAFEQAGSFLKAASRCEGLRADCRHAGGGRSTGTVDRSI